MNLREMILEVRSALDEPSSVSKMWTDTELTRWLNQAVRIMVSTSLPLQAVYTTPTVVGQQEYVLPQDVIRVYSAAFNNGRYYQLRPADFVGAQNGVFVQGIPSYFYLRTLSRQTAGMTTNPALTPPNTVIDVEPADPNKQERSRMILGLLPAPSTASTLLVYYYSRAMKLENDGDETSIPEEFQDGICAYAIAKGKEKDLAFEEAQVYFSRFKDHMEGLRSQMLLDANDMSFPHVTNPDESEYMTDLLMDSRFILPS